MKKFAQLLAVLFILAIIVTVIVPAYASEQYKVIVKDEINGNSVTLSYSSIEAAMLSAEARMHLAPGFTASGATVTLRGESNVVEAIRAKLERQGVKGWYMYTIEPTFAPDYWVDPTGEAGSIQVIVG